MTEYAKYILMWRKRQTGRKWIKCCVRFLLFGLILLLGTILLCNRIIIHNTESCLYDQVETIPENRVGLLLGTSPKLRGGRPNLYFNYRITAAVELFQAGKISRILVSGDNRRMNYNEPVEMRKALIAHGIPDSVIVMDFAGIRTLDSVIRAKKCSDRIGLLSSPNGFITREPCILPGGMESKPSVLMRKMSMSIVVLRPGSGNYWPG